MRNPGEPEQEKAGYQVSTMLNIPRTPPIINNTRVIAYRPCKHFHGNILSIFLFSRAPRVVGSLGSASVITPTPKTMKEKLINSQTLAQHMSLSLLVFCGHYITKGDKGGEVDKHLQRIME